MPKTRKSNKKLSYLKCRRCRFDKAKCLPEGRVWPGRRCSRCERYDYQCSESRTKTEEATLNQPPAESLARSSVAPEDSPSLSLDRSPSCPCRDYGLSAQTNDRLTAEYGDLSPYEHAVSTTERQANLSAKTNDQLITEYGDLSRLKGFVPKGHVMSIAIQQVDVVEVIKARISSYDKHEQSQNYLRQHIDMIQSAASRCYQKISTADLRDHVSSRKVARMYIDQGNHFAAEHILSGSLILNASSNPQGNKEVTVDPFRDRIVGELGKLCRFYRERAIKYEREETLLVTPKIDLHLAVSRATLDLAARVDIHGLCIRLYHSGAICHEAFDEALFFAAKYDAPSLARFAFALGVGTDAVDAHGKTALHKAIEHQSVEVAKLLTARRADIEARDEAMETPLHKAVACGSKDLVTLLLSNGADIQASNNMKETPLHKATASAAISLVELLVSKGAIVDARNSFEWTSLHKAAMTGSVYLVKFLLSKYANIDAQDQYRRTALTYAIQREHSRVVECLLEHGAFVNLADREGLTALHHATIHKDYDVVRLLLRYGADIEARDNDSMTTLMRAAGEGTFQITQCLLEKGASIDTQDRWRSTALHRAAARKDLSIWGLLLDYHADPTVQDEDCNTALDLACDIFRDSPHTFHDFQTKILKARLCAEGTAQSHPTRTHPSTEDPQNYHRMSTNTSSDFMEPFRPLCVPLWPAGIPDC